MVREVQNFSASDFAADDSAGRRRHVYRKGVPQNEPTRPEPGAEPARRAILNIRLQDISDNMVQFRLGGTTFRIPISYLHTIMESSRYFDGEIGTGFRLVGLWPGFEWRNRETLGRFTAAPSQRDSVRLPIRYHCPWRNPVTGPQPPCDPDTQMRSLYGIFGFQSSLSNWFVPADPTDPMPGRIPDFPGMIYQGYAVANHNNEHRHAQHLIYHGVDADGITRFARCGPPDSSYHHSCQIWVRWNERFYVILSINGTLIPEWQAIHATSIQRLESFIVNDDTPPPPPGTSWVIFP